MLEETSIWFLNGLLECSGFYTSVPQWNCKQHKKVDKLILVLRTPYGVHSHK